MSKFTDRIKNLYIRYRSLDYIGTSRVKAFITMITGFCVAVFKLVFGIIVESLVWGYSGIYTMGMAVCKLLSFYAAKQTNNEKRKAKFILAISIIMIVCAVLFDECSMIRQISNEKGARYPLFVIIISTTYFVVSYVLAIIGLFQTRKRKELEYFAMKTIGISGALMNMVLLQRMILSCIVLSDEISLQINSWFSYIVGAFLTLTAVILLIKCCLYQRKLKSGNMFGNNDDGIQ